MCGRLALPIPFARLVGLLRGDPGFPAGAAGEDDDRWRTAPWKPSWNIAPRATIPAVVLGEDGVATWKFLRWGLVPRWADDPSIGDRLVNARAETIALKPSFREAWRKRRCLVPAAAFYEWKRAGARREPWAFGPGPAYGPDAAVIWLGGIHESRRAPDGSESATFAIVTTSANEVVAPVHDRMPVVVSPDERARWIGLGSGTGQPPPEELLGPVAPGLLRAWRVSTFVNDARRDGEECLVPLDGDPA
jgi:putative SOS response-associated peptidase YedK